MTSRTVRAILSGSWGLYDAKTGHSREASGALLGWGPAGFNPVLQYLTDNARVSSVRVLLPTPGCRVETKKGRKKKSRAGWPGFSWRRVGCGYIAARRELALKLPLAGLGPLRLPGTCSFRPVPDRQSQDHSVQVEDKRSWETDMSEGASSMPQGISCYTSEKCWQITVNTQFAAPPWEVAEHLPESGEAKFCTRCT
jgi:hypothetical protein